MERNEVQSHFRTNVHTSVPAVIVVIEPTVTLDNRGLGGSLLTRQQSFRSLLAVGGAIACLQP